MSSVSIAKGICDLLEPFRDLPCVGGKLYLGSMFYLDFGDSFIVSNRRGEHIQISEMSLSIRNVAWWLYRGNTLLATAEKVTTRRFTQILKALIGSCMSVDKQEEEQRLKIQLGQKHALIVDLTNMWGTDSDVLEFAFPDGRLVAVDENGELALNAGRDQERAKRWSASIRRH